MPYSSLPTLTPPPSLNYIAVFLTLKCHLNCSYCINDPSQAGTRRKLFDNKTSLSPDEWAQGLARIPYTENLPITLQGGEPMVYWQGKGIGHILEKLPHRFDLLTSFAQHPEQFVKSLLGQEKKLTRSAPYPSIRVSYHAEQMEKVWHNKGFEELVDRCVGLSDFGFRVSPEKSQSDVGIYMVEHPENHVSEHMKKCYTGRIPFETKEFLGEYENRLFGTYLYPFSTNLVSSNTWHKTLSCECRTTELLIDPLGFVFGCHFHLYENWIQGGTADAFDILSTLKFDFEASQENLFLNNSNAPIGHILDPQFSMSALNQFRACHDYGRCIGCDTKVKNNRFQSLDDQNQAHTSVEIKNIQFPDELLSIDDVQSYRDKVSSHDH
jgi:hypothetical protein